MNADLGQIAFNIDSEPVKELDIPEFMDHGQVAWDHFLAQHLNKGETEDFVKCFYNPINALSRTYRRLYIFRRISTASGEQLDLIGSIVGISRIIQNAVFIPFFGFISQIAGRAFGVARIRRKGEPWSESLTLDDVSYRRLILVKIAMNNSHGTAEELMYIVNTMFNITGTGVIDAGNAKFKLYIPAMNDPTDPRLAYLDWLIMKAGGVGWEISEAPGSQWDVGESIWDDGFSLWDVGIAPS